MEQFEAKVTRIIDGDTLEVVIQLPFDLSLNTTIRLFGINAPEMKGQSHGKGLASKNRLIELVDQQDITVELAHRQKEKYGRYLATIFKDNVNINEQMVNEGFAVKYLPLTVEGLVDFSKLLA